MKQVYLDNCSFIESLDSASLHIGQKLGVKLYSQTTVYF
ncbi:hypothetical protein ZORO111903_02170 [Zobellia roscoffensis]